LEKTLATFIPFEIRFPSSLNPNFTALVELCPYQLYN
jgi:hypothetical protein